MSKNHFVFVSISDQYQNFYFVNLFCKMAAAGHFGCPKITFGRISAHFRAIRNFKKNVFTKWPPAPILDVRNSLSIAFLAISDRYATLFSVDIFDKMADVGHFGCPKFTFDRISGHFRSIGHFECPKITFDGISGHFRSIRILIIFFNF